MVHCQIDYWRVARESSLKRVKAISSLRLSSRPATPFSGVSIYRPPTVLRAVIFLKVLTVSHKNLAQQQQEEC